MPYPSCLRRSALKPTLTVAELRRAIVASADEKTIGKGNRIRLLNPRAAVIDNSRGVAFARTRVTRRSIEVGLATVDANDLLSTWSGTHNQFTFRTSRYREQPWVIT